MRDVSMLFGGRERLEEVETILSRAGFDFSKPCLSRPSCFDYVARKGKRTLLVKLQSDIGCFLRNDSEELRGISRDFSAAPIVIGREAREKLLEDDTIYSRHQTLVITVKTFENALFHSLKPLIQASPGGCFVEIDGKALKKKRLELGLSIREIADRVGVSRRTIYSYERGLAKASVPAAYKLVFALGIPIARPIDIMQPATCSQKSCILRKARRAFSRNRLLSRILRRLALLNLTTVRRAPFDFVLNVPEEDVLVIGGVEDQREPALNLRIGEMLSVAKVVGAKSLLVTEDQRILKDPGITHVTCADFSRIEQAQDIVAMFK